MKEQTKTKVRGYIAAIVVLAVVAGVLALGYIGSNVALSTYSTQLENNYQRSVYELIDDVNSIESNLSKASISYGGEAKQKLFNKIYTDCVRANEDLSRLPINHESVNQTTSFINQMGGFSYYAENKLKNGQDLSQEDNQSVQALYQLCVYVQSILNDFASTYQGNYSVLANTKNIGDTKNSFNSMFSSMQAEGVDIPTLIYDGPFSEAQTKKEIKGLSNSIQTQEQAQAKLESVFENLSNLKYEGETTGLFETYNFSFDLNERHLYAQIAKRDAFILSISSYASSDNDSLELEECKQKAEEFASNLGLDLKAVWGTKITGMAYINLTPVINGTIIYPDMIKVKISCSTGEILGWEAQSYAYNHIDRDLPQVEVAESNARSKVSSSLTIESQKLALIPIKYGNETLCYEYKCSLNNSTYYVYINAVTGEEEQILKVIRTTNGDLLM